MGKILNVVIGAFIWAVLMISTHNQPSQKNVHFHFLFFLVVLIKWGTAADLCQQIHSSKQTVHLHVRLSTMVSHMNTAKKKTSMNIMYFYASI